MKNPSTFHPCAVCDRLVRDGLLMCLPHWKLVPHAQQQAVYSTWGLVQHANGGAGAVQRVQRWYHAARDVAVASAQAALGHAGTAAMTETATDATTSEESTQ